MAALSLAQARTQLENALQNLHAMRLEQEAAQPQAAGPEALGAAPAIAPGHPRLALDEFEHTDFTQRPHLRLAGAITGPTDRPPATAPAAPLSSLLQPIQLDALTVADDPGWLERVSSEMNLPSYLPTGLRALYTADRAVP